MSRKATLLAVAGLVALVAPAVAVAAPSSAADGDGQRTTCRVLAFDTDQHRFRVGHDNQGWVTADNTGFWFSDTDSYQVGFEYEAPYIINNWFTFDLAGLPAGSVIRASLVIRNDHAVYGTGGLLRFHQVTTRPKALNQRTADPNSAFNDLGDGPVYASKNVTTAMLAPDRLTIPLNKAGIAAVNHAAGHLISFGGELSNSDSSVWSAIIWRDSSAIGRQRLSVTSCT